MRHRRELTACREIAFDARFVGVDLSGDLLAEAAKQGGGPSFVRADVRALPFRAGAFASDRWTTNAPPSGWRRVSRPRRSSPPG